jgi:hypothetical protein
MDRRKPLAMTLCLYANHRAEFPPPPGFLTSLTASGHQYMHACAKTPKIVPPAARCFEDRRSPKAAKLHDRTSADPAALYLCADADTWKSCVRFPLDRLVFISIYMFYIF